MTWFGRTRRSSACLPFPVSNFGIRPSACWPVLPFVASASREASVELPCLSDFSSSLVGGRVTFDAANADECKRTNLQRGSIVLVGKILAPAGS